MTKYSDELIAKMQEIGTFNYDSAKAFAEANGLTFRSVVAKIRAIKGVDYIVKDAKTTKVTSKSKARAKADIVTAVQGLLGMELKSLDKMTVADLTALENELQARVEA